MNYLNYFDEWNMVHGIKRVKTFEHDYDKTMLLIENNFSDDQFKYYHIQTPIYTMSYSVWVS